MLNKDFFNFFTLWNNFGSECCLLDKFAAAGIERGTSLSRSNNVCHKTAATKAGIDSIVPECFNFSRAFGIDSFQCKLMQWCLLMPWVNSSDSYPMPLYKKFTRTSALSNKCKIFTCSQSLRHVQPVARIINFTTSYLRRRTELSRLLSTDTSMDLFDT